MNQTNRRTFLRRTAGGAVLLATSRALGANDRVRLGLIGAGGRGKEIFKAALALPNTEAAAVADVFTLRHDEVKKFAPNVKTYSDFRRLLDDKSVDAVLIATPQHLHALHFVPAIQAGKDVYQEKTMAFHPEHAKRMRKALTGSGRIVQVGIQSTSGSDLEKVRVMASAEKIGKITAIHSHMYRNSPYGGWRTPIPAECTAANVDWPAFEGEAEHKPFTPDRCIHWRFYWEYSGGNVFENMVHQVGFWYKALNLQIPRSVSMHGGNYLSPEMQVPDTMNVSMEQPEGLLFTWNSGFGNRHYKTDEQVLGQKGSILRDERENVSYVPEGPAEGTGAIHESEIAGRPSTTSRHLQNFLDCVRTRNQPNCPLEIGFRSAVACRMAVQSYRERRTVSWDPKKEEIV